MSIWQRAPLLIRSWQGETVVFHRESGDTHLVDELTARVLRRLDAGALDEAQLAACLDVEGGADFRDMLNHLAASGLISCRSA